MSLLLGREEEEGGGGGARGEGENIGMLCAGHTIACYIKPLLATVCTQCVLSASERPVRYLSFSHLSNPKS